MRCALALATVLLTAACGANSTTRSARPQRVELDWHENCGTRAERIPITTRRLIVRSRSWQVDLSFRNETGVTLAVIRPHTDSGTYFGLEAFETTSWREVMRRADENRVKPSVFADRFTPSRPGWLSPGERWSGSFAGPGSLPAGVPIRVVIGRFTVPGRPSRPIFRGFLCISERVIRLR